jgi:hypothetical protein
MVSTVRALLTLRQHDWMPAPDDGLARRRRSLDNQRLLAGRPQVGGMFVLYLGRL